MLMMFPRKPFRGGKLTNDMPEEWVVRAFSFPPLAEGQAPPPDSLVINLHKGLVDENGARVPLATLAQYDLAKGLRDTLMRAWA